MADQILFSCSGCGSKDFVFPNQPPKGDDIISCAGCKREIGRYEVVKKAIVDAGKAEIDKMVEGAFGKGVKPKWR